MSTFNRDQQTPRHVRGAHVDERPLAAEPAGAPTLRESRDGWLRDGRRRQLSPDTRQSYRESTDEFLAVVGPQRTADSLIAEDLDRYLVALNSASRAHGPLSVATQGARIARVRAWLNWAWHEGDLTTALGGQLRPRSVPVTTPPPLPLAQIRLMLGRASLRNQVLLLILLDTGLRIGDALRLRRTDLCHMQDGQPYFEVAVSKTHSGGQAPISATTERVLRRYLHREFPRLWPAAWVPVRARRTPLSSFRRAVGATRLTAVRWRSSVRASSKRPGGLGNAHPTSSAIRLGTSPRKWDSTKSGSLSTSDIGRSRWSSGIRGRSASFVTSMR